MFFSFLTILDNPMVSDNRMRQLRQHPLWCRWAQTRSDGQSQSSGEPRRDKEQVLLPKVYEMSRESLSPCPYRFPMK